MKLEIGPGSYIKMESRIGIKTMLIQSTDCTKKIYTLCKVHS
jgi:hypothetical protein